MNRTRTRRVLRAALLLLALSTISPGAAEAMEPSVTTPPPAVAGARLVPVTFDALPGWAADDHAAAFVTFLKTCRRVQETADDLRPAMAGPPALKSVCRMALAAGNLGPAEARRFFEQQFAAWSIRPDRGEGFLTGYYEPEVEGSRTTLADYPVPVLRRPADLVTIRSGETLPGLPPGLAAARRTATGHEPFPDRAAIQDGALEGQGLEILWLRDRVELFMAQVQGSARVRLLDGELLRLVYAGRNGHPYTSIGKVIVSEGHMRLEDMTLASLKAWLRAHPAEADRIMRMNRSYIFFDLAEGLDPADGPIGGASVPLTTLRSIAVDRGLWPYGLPFWIAARLPLGEVSAETGFARLMIAQDTGSAILGPARADLFLGSGPEAGDRAGAIRHAGTFTVLWPRGEDP